MFPRNHVMVEPMINEMLAFPSGLHDDMVDALAWIGRMMVLFTPTFDPRPAPKKSWRDKVGKSKNSAKNFMKS